MISGQRNRAYTFSTKTKREKKIFSQETGLQGNNYAASKQLQSKGYLPIMTESFLFPAS